MNDGISISRYRGILQPSADSNQRDASQVASIHLSNNKTVELDNVCSWVLSYKTCGWMRSLHIFYIVFATTLFEMIWKQLVNTKNLRSFENEVRPAWSKGSKELEVLFHHLWLTGVSSFDEASVVPVLLKQLKKKRKNYDKNKADGAICVQ